MFQKIRKTFYEYPSTFWVMISASFIDQLGSALLFPFFALYVTDHFGVGMTEVGFLFSMFSIGHILGGTIGGALTDKFGRRVMLLLGIITSGAGSLVMGFVNDLTILFIVALFLGITGSLGGPAQQAMVADLLPEKQRAEGYSALRVISNLAVTIGPTIGGLLASINYLYLFIGDAIMSGITAIIVFFVIPETKPEIHKDKKQDSLIQTIAGYGVVLKDGVFLLFFFLCSIMSLVYMQMNSTLSVFLRDFHGFPLESFGILLSMNAAMVVFSQFWVTRKISGFKGLIVMGIGMILYAIGLSMYGFVSSPVFFFIAMIIITIGEIVIAPFSQSMVAHLAPEDKRGRYMAIFSFSWAIPSIFGVIIAGLIMDNYDPRWVWYLCGIFGLIGAWGFFLLHKIAQKRFIIHEKQLDETCYEI